MAFGFHGSKSFPLGQDDHAAQRKALWDQVKAHETRVIELKGCINTMAPISRLPPEILSEVFALVAISDYEAQRRNHYGPSHAYKWITLTHVCRIWRTVALNTPRLWSRIVLTKPDVAREVLARSKKAPLWVSATVAYRDDARLPILDTLMQESSRIKEFRLTGPARLVQALSTKWRLPANMLESMFLSSDVKPFDRDSFLPTLPLSSDFLSGQIPRLRRLEIHRITVDWTNPLFCPSLKTLIVHARYDTTPKLGEFSQLLTALENMPLLETLNLNEAIPRLPDDATNLPAVQHAVTLPALRSLDLFSDAIECAKLLRHLSLPHNTRIIVNGRTDRGVKDLVQAFGEQLGHSDPPRTARLAPLYSSQIYVKLWRSYTSSTEEGLLSPDAELSLDAFPHSRSIQTLVNDATFFSQLHRFEVHTTYRNWHWGALFGRMDELQVLSVIGHPDFDFLPALSVVRDVEGDPVGELPMPHLHTLELESVRFGCPHSNHESEFLEELLDWLVLRCNYGSPLLKLVLRTCINVEAEAVARLEDIVPHLEWDGRDDIRDENVDADEDDDLDEYYDDELFIPFDPMDAYDDEELELWMIPFGV
ncbi:hypothetical protein BV20DRAFT_968410 [Pilatotrama ljubarskyi]|nr:hypothetical protein BV20DRAFT_968410 [Pilatotrama ljubarskyi]